MRCKKFVLPQKVMPAETSVGEHRDLLHRPMVMDLALSSAFLPIWSRAVDTFIGGPEGPASYIAEKGLDTRTGLRMHQELIEGAIHAYQQTEHWSGVDSENRDKIKDLAGEALVASMVWMNREDSAYLREGYSYSWEHDRLMQEMRYSGLAEAITHLPSTDMQIRCWQFITSVLKETSNVDAYQESLALLEEILIMNSISTQRSLVENNVVQLNSLNHWLSFLSDTHAEKKTQAGRIAAIGHSFQRIGRWRDANYPLYPAIVKSYAEHYRYLGEDGLDGMLRMLDQPDVLSNKDFQECLKYAIQFNSKIAHKMFDKRIASGYVYDRRQAGLLLPYIQNIYPVRDFTFELNVLTVDEDPAVRSAALMSVGLIEHEDRNKNTGIQFQAQNIITFALEEERDPEVRLSLYKNVLPLVSSELAALMIENWGLKEKDPKIQSIVREFTKKQKLI